MSEDEFRLQSGYNFEDDPGAPPHALPHRKFDGEQVDPEVILSGLGPDSKIITMVDEQDENGEEVAIVTIETDEYDTSRHLDGQGAELPATAGDS